MNQLRTAVFMLIGLLANTVALGEGLDPNVASLKAPLGLSEQQAQELSVAYKEARDRMQALRKEMKEVNKTKQAKIDAALTPEQKKKYEEMRNPSLPAEAGPPPLMVPMDNAPEQPATK
jgi:hypothetical protein